VPPRGKRLYFIGENRAFTISPDGSILVYTVEVGVSSELRLRPMNSETSTPIRGSEGAKHPFFSPDGKEIFYLCGTRFMAAPVSVKGDEFVPPTPYVLFENRQIWCFDAENLAEIDGIAFHAGEKK